MQGEANRTISHKTEACAGIVCSPSLVELFRALCSVAEDNAFVSAAHPAYAGLMERSLSKVVVVHVSGLERLCQVGLQLDQNNSAT